MRSHEGTRLPNGGFTPVVGKYNAAEPIGYWMQQGDPPKVFVHVPTQSGGSYSYIEFTFDARSGEILGVIHGMIH
jgi:hypothetical protein